MMFTEEEKSLIAAAENNIRQNQREVIEVITKKFGINNVNYDKSIAVIANGRLLISVIYGEGIHLSKNMPITDPEAQSIIEEASRKMAESMRDVMERYRLLKKAHY